MPPFSPEDHQVQYDDEDVVGVAMTEDEDVVIVGKQKHEESTAFSVVVVDGLDLGHQGAEEDNDLDNSIRRNKLNFANLVSDGHDMEEKEQEKDGEEEEEDTDIMQQSQGYWYCGKTGFKKTILSPITELQVTFAGHVIKDENDGGRVLLVLDAVKISPIPHVSEYTPEDKRNLWYTQKEMSSMKRNCVDNVRKITKQTELYCPLFFRGLERHIDDAINTTNSTSKDRRWGATVAVLQEQQEQRFLCAKIYGMVYGGMMDPDKIRHAYMTQGDTKRSQWIAHNLARQDEAHAKECLEEDLVVKREIEYEDDDDDDHHHHNCNDKNVLSNGVRSVLHSLLNPFFEMRHGDIYLGMGEECF